MRILCAKLNTLLPKTATGCIAAEFCLRGHNRLESSSGLLTSTAPISARSWPSGIMSILFSRYPYNHGCIENITIFHLANMLMVLQKSDLRRHQESSFEGLSVGDNAAATVVWRRSASREYVPPKSAQYPFLLSLYVIHTPLLMLISAHEPR